MNCDLKFSFNEVLTPTIYIGYTIFVLTNSDIMRYKLGKSSHAVYSLTYHYIAVVKYRRKIFISDKIINRLKTINYDIAEKFGIEIINQETDLDHIHILLKATPKVELTKFINSLKGVSARKLFQEFPEIKNQLWKGKIWNPSYFLCTTGQVTLDQLIHYVNSQEGK